VPSRLWPHVASYDVFADLTAEPVRTRTEIRFDCREPGAGTFADLMATAVRAALNGRELAGPADGRLALPGVLARALYPATLAEPATLAVTAAALERGGLSDGMRLVPQEQEVILRAALAARSVPRRWA